MACVRTEMCKVKVGINFEYDCLKLIKKINEYHFKYFPKNNLNDYFVHRRVMEMNPHTEDYWNDNTDEEGETIINNEYINKEVCDYMITKLCNFWLVDCEVPLDIKLFERIVSINMECMCGKGKVWEYGTVKKHRFYLQNPLLNFIELSRDTEKEDIWREFEYDYIRVYFEDMGTNFYRTYGIPYKSRLVISNRLENINKFQKMILDFNKKCKGDLNNYFIRKIQMWWKKKLYNPHTPLGKRFALQQIEFAFEE